MRRAGEELGGYVLLRSLGSGGMGTVYEALDADHRRVALKLLHPHIGADPAARDRLRREVATLHRVRHTGVARVLDAEVDSDEAFVVTELVEGRTLEAAVREDGPFAGPDLTALARGLAGALAAIHVAGVVHRDVKPANVMLTEDGPVLIDFGISQIVEESERVTQTGMVAGTPGYLDPQVVAGGAPGAAADWWAWSAVLAFAATGRPPFGRAAMDVVLTRVARGDPDLAGLPDDVARALRAALAPEPTSRFSPADVLAVLGGDRSPLARLARPAPSLSPPPAPVLPARVAPAVTAPPRAASGGAAPPPHPAGLVRTPTTAPRRSALPLAGPYLPSGTAGGIGAVAGPAPGTALASRAATYPPGPFAAPLAHPAMHRSGVLAAIWIAAAGLAALWPGWVVLVTLGAMVLAGAVGSGVQATRRRRARSGVRRSDIPVAWAATPWHLLLGVLVVAVGLLPGALAAGVVWAVGWLLATGGSGALSDAGGPIEAAVTAAAAAAGLGATWLSPTGGLARFGAREVARVALPGRAWGAVVVVLGIAIALAAASAVLLAGATPDVAPFSQPSG